MVKMVKKMVALIPLFFKGIWELAYTLLQFSSSKVVRQIMLLLKIILAVIYIGLKITKAILNRKSKKAICLYSDSFFVIILIINK